MNRYPFYFGLVAALGLSVLVLGGCEEAPASCEDGDRTYADGAHWTCSDGCNFCGCSDGSVTTTAIGCPEPPGPAAGKLQCHSEADDFWYTHGDTWACDGCSTCSCSDGETLVEERACSEGGAPG
jgi:hypothetical protein